MDTNVIVAAMIREDGAGRSVLRACLQHQVQPLVGEALYLEYEDVLDRPDAMVRSPLSKAERHILLDAFLSVSEWVDIYFGWRPNLRDEGDNHLIELAVSGGAGWILTRNIADFMGGELKFPQIRVAEPHVFLREALGGAVS